jgi:hypothetical protein
MPTAAPAAGTGQPGSPSAGTGTGASTGAGAKGKGLSAGDAKTIEEELTAIEKELDRLDVPSDGDLDDISSGLK